MTNKELIQYIVGDQLDLPVPTEVDAESMTMIRYLDKVFDWAADLDMHGEKSDQAVRDLALRTAQPVIDNLRRRLVS